MVNSASVSMGGGLLNKDAKKLLQALENCLRCAPKLHERPSSLDLQSAENCTAKKWSSLHLFERPLHFRLILTHRLYIWSPRGEYKQYFFNKGSKRITIKVEKKLWSWGICNFALSYSIDYTSSWEICYPVPWLRLILNIISKLKNQL